MSDFPLALLDVKSAAATAVSPTIDHHSRTAIREWHSGRICYVQFLQPSSVVWWNNTIDLSQVLGWSRSWKRLYDALDHLKGLAANWDSYGSSAPNARSIANARAVLDEAFLLNLQPSAVLPSAEGGIFISFDSAGRHANLECLNDGDIYAAIRDPLDVWPLAADDGINNSIRRIAAYIGGHDRAVAI